VKYYLRDGCVTWKKIFREDLTNEVYIPSEFIRQSKWVTEVPC